MQLHYFIVDQREQLHKVPRDDVERLWRNEISAERLTIRLGDELRLVSVLCDEDLLPKISFFSRLRLRRGKITDESRIEAYEAMSTADRRRYDRPSAQRQFAGWPSDWQTQLAVALDVPVQQLRRIGLGGPLLMSDLWGISVEQILEYFEAADREHGD